ARRGHGAPGPGAGGGGPARRVVRLLADVQGRPGAARARDGVLRRALSLGPRRDGRDAQLAVDEGEAGEGARAVARVTGGSGTRATAPHGVVAGSDAPPVPESITLSQANRVWAGVGLRSFGGPTAQIALMHRVLVDERRWLSDREFLDALGF